MVRVAIPLTGGRIVCSTQPSALEVGSAVRMEGRRLGTNVWVRCWEDGECSEDGGEDIGDQCMGKMLGGWGMSSWNQKGTMEDFSYCCR